MTDRAESDHSVVRRLAAISTAALLAVGLLGVSAAGVLAGPESGVDIIIHNADTEDVAPGDPPTACTFHLHFVASEAIEGAFEIRAGDEDGDAVVTGLFDTTSGDSRAPDSGVYELDEGTYEIVWDDEVEQDQSFDQQTIVVACEAETTPPTPTPTGTEVPVSPSPTGSELPVESEAPTPTGTEAPVGGEAPTGDVGGVTATPPATDTGEAPTSDSSQGGALAIAALLGLTGMLVARTVGVRTAVARERVRRR